MYGVTTQILFKIETNSQISNETIPKTNCILNVSVAYVSSGNTFRGRLHTTKCYVHMKVKQYIVREKALYVVMGSR